MPAAAAPTRGLAQSGTLAPMSTDQVAVDHGLLEEIRAAVGEGEVEHFLEEAARTRLRDLAFARILDELQAEVGPIPDELMAEAEAFWTAES